MKSKYVQLPPLPLDMPLEVMETIWLYARLSEQEQKMIRDFIQKKLNGNKENSDETEFVGILQDSETEISPEICEFTELMKKMLGTVIAQSCEIAALVYQNYCIEKKSSKEISGQFHVDEEIIRMVAQYYEESSP